MKPNLLLLMLLKTTAMLLLLLLPPPWNKKHKISPSMISNPKSTECPASQSSVLY